MSRWLDMTLVCPVRGSKATGGRVHHDPSVSRATARNNACNADTSATKLARSDRRWRSGACDAGRRKALLKAVGPRGSAPMAHGACEDWTKLVLHRVCAVPRPRCGCTSAPPLSSRGRRHGFGLCLGATARAHTEPRDTPASTRCPPGSTRSGLRRSTPRAPARIAP